MSRKEDIVEIWRIIDTIREISQDDIMLLSDEQIKRIKIILNETHKDIMSV